VGDVPHDPRLYITQILLVLASSPLAWTGTRNAFNLVGYSLGGGIAVHFANTFPHLVSSLVLLAPAGLIRAESFGITRHIFTSGFVPEFILSKLTARRLQTPIASSKTARAIAEADNTPAKLAEAEAADPPNGESVTPLEQRVLKYVRWMVRNHSGFVPAFMSSIRHAPLVDQHESWAKLSRRDSGSTIVMLARSDEIINVNEYTEVGLPLVGGKDHVVWEVLPGGHDFVMTHSPDIVRILDREWEL
jgi:pimeloyl-ACP methyl ester carboxylesterase